MEAIDVQRLTGKEQFVADSKIVGLDLLSFWQWSSSDLVGNALRGVLAEYIVSYAVGNGGGVRTEWDAYDVETNTGLKVEVKSGAYLQSWMQEKLSPIQFSIRPTYGWDSETNTTSSIKERQADVYIFCVLAHEDKATVNPLNLDQWDFYCVSTKTLNQELGDQKTLSLSTMLKLKSSKVSFNELSDAIQTAAKNCI